MEFVRLSGCSLLNAGFHLLDRVVYISEVRCAAVYGLHFVKCIQLLRQTETEKLLTILEML
jgi:hypothetical protein